MKHLPDTWSASACVRKPDTDGLVSVREAGSKPPEQWFAPKPTLVLEAQDFSGLIEYRTDTYFVRLPQPTEVRPVLIGDHAAIAHGHNLEKWVESQKMRLPLAQ